MGLSNNFLCIPTLLNVPFYLLIGMWTGIYPLTRYDSPFCLSSRYELGVISVFGWVHVVMAAIQFGLFLYYASIEEKSRSDKPVALCGSYFLWSILTFALAIASMVYLSRHIPNHCIDSGPQSGLFAMYSLMLISSISLPLMIMVLLDDDHQDVFLPEFWYPMTTVPFTWILWPVFSLVLLADLLEE